MVLLVPRTVEGSVETGVRTGTKVEVNGRGQGKERKDKNIVDSTKTRVPET